MVEPGSVITVPLAVAPWPRTTADAPEIVSGKTVPEATEPEGVLKDQRLTRLAPAGPAPAHTNEASKTTLGRKSHGRGGNGMG
jgi:hypothetical protein